MPGSPGDGRRRRRCSEPPDRSFDLSAPGSTKLARVPRRRSDRAPSGQAERDSRESRRLRGPQHGLHTATPRRSRDRVDAPLDHASRARPGRSRRAAPARVRGGASTSSRERSPSTSPGAREELGSRRLRCASSGVPHALENDRDGARPLVEVSAPQPGRGISRTRSSSDTVAGAETEIAYRRGHFDVSRASPQPSSALGLAGFGARRTSAARRSKILINQDFGASQFNLMVVQYAPGGFISRARPCVRGGLLLPRGRDRGELDGETYTLARGRLLLERRREHARAHEPLRRAGALARDAGAAAAVAAPGPLRGDWERLVSGSERPVRRAAERSPTAPVAAPGRAARRSCRPTTPQTRPGARPREHGDAAEDDQVPGAVLRELLLQREEDDRADDRPLDRADAADHDDEDHVRRPVDTS